MDIKHLFDPDVKQEIIKRINKTLRTKKLGSY